MLIQRFNGHRANAAIRKWQFSNDFHLAMHGIIVGMSAECREEIRSHLDFNKREESGSFDENKIYYSRNDVSLLGWIQVTMSPFCAAKGIS